MVGDAGEASEGRLGLLHDQEPADMCVPSRWKQACHLLREERSQLLLGLVNDVPRAAHRNADVLAAVNTIMNDSGMGGSGYTVNIAPAVGGLPTGLTLTVTVSLTYANVDLTGVPIIPLPVTLSSSTSMAKEGP